MAETRFLVTDVTRMSGSSVCIAGYVREGDGYRCVRPVLADQNLPESWLITQPEPIRPFSILTLDLFTTSTRPPHIEDRLFVENAVKNHGQMGDHRRLPFLEAILDSLVAQLFDGHLRSDVKGRKWWVPERSQCRSLGTIRVFTPRVWYDEPTEISPKPRYTLQFRDAQDHEYRVSITDLATRRYIQSLVREERLTPNDAGQHLGKHLRNADHCLVRLGLARSWKDYPDRCYLQVTGIYSFPDYLDGRCHADFPTHYA